MKITRTLLALAVVGILGSTLPRDARPQDEATRGDRRIAGPKTEDADQPRYGKQWAIIIGIDYRPEDRLDAPDDVPPLRHAEADAAAVRELLRKFGYADEAVRYYPGRQWTHKRILEEVGALCNSDTVGEDDSVLVYFSGHGHLDHSLRGTGNGYLWPVDVKSDRGQINIGTAVELAGLVAMLDGKCPSRHKLLVLDCCHAGAVFRIAHLKSSGQFADLQPDRDVFRAKGLQAITASRDNQKASDGRNGHSPFTYALLQSLETLPISKGKRFGRRYFTASELFMRMRPYLNSENYQSPQCGWLGDELGEFHFLPGPEAAFGQNDLAEDDHKQLIALAPSTFGNWWALEVPWFMPGLRSVILEETVPTRSATYNFDRDTLYAAAKQAQQLAARTDNALYQMRYRHLERLIKAHGAEAQAAAFRDILADLDRMDQENKCQAEDLHYRAVILHLQGEFKKAQSSYQAASAKYQSEYGAGKSPLEALCLLDWGLLELMHLSDFDNAVQLFRQARMMFDQSPKPFQIFSLCREADAFRRRGKFGMSEDTMDQARDLLLQWDQQESHLFSAGIWKQQAWAWMESWNFKAADAAFHKARTILEVGLNQQRYESKIDAFHVLHGLAMVARYQGDARLALERYRALTPAIAQTIHELENRREDLPNSNFDEIRSLLYERLVNSLERQADCSLFAGQPDYAEAADDYRRAIRECRHVSAARKDLMLLDLLHRRTAALCLSISQRRRCERDAVPPESIVAEEVAELELARELARQAADLLATSEQLQGVREHPLRTRLAEYIAQASLAAVDCSLSDWQPAATARPLDDILTDIDRSARGLDRDQLERLMFLYRILIDHRRELGFNRFESLRHVDGLLALGRSACRLDDPDPELLSYLRPYYDSAFLAWKELMPRDTKVLVEIAWEATRGTPYMKPPAIQPLLVVHYVNDKCYLMVDAPYGNSDCFHLDEVRSREQMLEASRTEMLIALPDPVRKLLRAVEQREPRTRFTLRWRDPVSGIGYPPLYAAGRDSSSAEITTDAPADAAAVRTAFKPVLDVLGGVHDSLVPDESLTCPLNFGPVPMEEEPAQVFRRTGGSQHVAAR